MSMASRGYPQYAAELLPAYDREALAPRPAALPS